MEKMYLVLITILVSIVATADAAYVPSKFDGFVYRNHRFNKEDTIVIEAFYDPVCPDSRDSWPPLKEVLQHYGARISLSVHPFALPYHDNAYVTCRALHIVNQMKPSATYHMLEVFFREQEKLYNKPTHTLSREAVVKKVVKLVVDVVGNSSLAAVVSGFNDTQTDLTTRVSFKYGCSRGVYGTPFFFINGFLLPDGGSPIDYKGWRSIIDPLVGKQNQ